jgi:formylglycine-generating enzyme required for sulfatase activity/serine/threonine protein kinase
MATNDGVEPKRPEEPWWSQVAAAGEGGSGGKAPQAGSTVSYIGGTLAKTSGMMGMPTEFGRYRVHKQLGGGGMGAVYLVENTELKREEALKVPHFGVGDDPVVRERFLREARAAAQLDHANLCPVYDVGEINGVCFLTMRYLKGKLLSDYTGKPQPLRKAVEITAKLAQALESAHARGVIHRDLKPNNVMMCAGVGPVVMDFGLAKQTKSEDHKLTQSGTTLGTPSYMPPEQVKGELDRMGPASDVYSLAVILFEMLTGRLPFKAATVAEVYGLVLHTEAPSPSSLRPGLDPALDAICAKALAKTPEERYPSMKAFAAALIDFLKTAPAGKGAGNLTPTKAAPADIFQAATVAPNQAAISTPALRGEPTQRGSKALGSGQPPKPWFWSNHPVGTAVAFALLIIAIGLWAGSVIRVRTADGILVVEVNEPNPDVYVDGEKVTVAWQNGGVKAEVGVKPGTRKVELKKDGFRVYGQEVTLEDHGRTMLVARLDPSQSTTPTQVVPAPSVDASQRETGKVRPQPLDCTDPNGVSADVVRRAQEAWAKYLGRDVEAKVEIANGVTMTFVLVPPGKFRMGSPSDEMGRYQNETLHVVTLTEPFDLGKYEVTQAQYQALTGKDPSAFKGGERPVECVTWGEADAFGRDLTKKRSDKHLYRLPTEAEWEYSCRGGRSSSQAFGVGDGRALTSRDANFNNGLRETRNVGSYAANALGLYDMHGNVWEWCADWNEPYPNEAVTNPLRAAGSPYRVARGGCWNEGAKECRSALRQGSGPERRDGYMGFRLARSSPSGGK